ncbi:2-dehydro-3-deoxyphosphogalactonate aldolase [Angulomicrobium tetraedrale]|uniref:2-dehydro-3-deoxyphosphogalactonate aldolase n=1 Tax=Ancylobacter tetraedralis TaxID=217068 RepID=A0A839Z836_9HYPH|nr:2-dehydro-3-deoxy-6-phosphogalactonate aldolase [Ancylobacter tetraedralis]MBB3769467.1 2-dehydro-3-deoxyphosphogalactonate aldolase [Ancylobacter tetraedralis]
MTALSAPAPAGVTWPGLRRSLVAILRGIAPLEAEAIVGALIEEGLEAIEIPLNSPDPFRSIETAARLAPSGVLIGAGTVLTSADVDRLAAAGGRLMVSPNVDPEVIARASGHGMVTMPGVLTPTEALAAVKAGASALKFFPANLLGPSIIQAITVILPAGTVVGAVGGVGENEFAAYARAGIRTFGLGSSLYRPGADADEVRARARAIIAAYDAACPAPTEPPTEIRHAPS